MYFPSSAARTTTYSPPPTSAADRISIPRAHRSRTTTLSFDRTSVPAREAGGPIGGRIGRLAYPLACLVLAAVSLVAGSASAAPIVVETGDATSTNQCTLARAIDTARAGASIGACSWGGESRIALDSGQTYRLPAVPAPIDFDLEIAGSFTIDDKARIEYDSSVSGRFFEVEGTAELRLRLLTLHGGQADHGGALRLRPGTEAHLYGVTIENATATLDGGAIHNEGTLEVTHTTLIGNTSGHRGGAIYNGGNGTLELLRSLVAGGSAIRGGGVYQDGGPISVLDSTFSANSAYLGGALYGKSGASVIDFSTFRNNLADDIASAFLLEWGSLDLQRSALSTDSASVDLCYGSQYLQSGGANAFSDGSCIHSSATPPPVADQQVGAPIDFGELVFHGGLTQVHPPRCQWTPAGTCVSPLVDAIEKRDCRVAGAVPRDQRDQNTRWNLSLPPAETDPTCDIGAYESICESHSFALSTRSVLLHEYQLGSGSAPTLLDSGACFVHPSCDPDDPNEPCDRIQWRTDRGQLGIEDVIFIDAQCRDQLQLDCFEDPDACVDQCPSAPPAGWVEDPNAAPGTFAFLVSTPVENLRQGAPAGARAPAKPDRVRTKSSGSQTVLRPYVIELRDQSDPNAVPWRWDPQTPVLEEDMLESP